MFFTIDDVAELLKIKKNSSRIICNRYVKKGIFVRIKRNLYVTEQSFSKYSTRDFFFLANYTQVPSYISFMSALSYYGISTQVQRGFIESAGVKRSVKYDAKGVNFIFYKIKEKYYNSFIKENNIFIATKEKAFVDAVYLSSFGKYKMDFNSIDYRKLNNGEIKKIIKKYPLRTRLMVESLCRNS